MMRRSFFSALLAGTIVLASAGAQATPSRAVALGDMGLYIEDDTNVLRYPGLLGKYSHFVYVDLAGTSGLRPALTETQQGGLNGGAFLRLSEGFHLGVVASAFTATEQNAFLNQIAQAPGAVNAGVFNSMVNEAPLRRYDLIFAYSEGKSFGAGLRLAYGSNSETFVPDENAQTSEGNSRDVDSRSQTQFRATAGVSGLLGDAGSYDLALDYNYSGIGYEKNGESTFLGGSGHSIGLSARARFILSRFWDIVPQVSYRGGSMNLTEDGVIPAFGEASDEEWTEFADKAERVHSRSRHTLDVGAAAALRASSKANFWIATGVLVDTVYTYLDAYKIAPVSIVEGRQTTTSLPYVRFGVEGSPLEWLQLRGGVEKYAFRTSESLFVDPEEGESFSQSGSRALGREVADFSTYVGASFLLNGFQLDLLLDQDFFKRGPAFISGASGNLAGRATVSYKF